MQNQLKLSKLSPKLVRTVLVFAEHSFVELSNTSFLLSVAGLYCLIHVFSD